MDIVQAFIKDQFNDDDDYYEGNARSKGRREGGRENREGREVQNLKKELEELKFYQELERTEYEDMKKKLYNMERHAARTPRKTNDRNSIAETSADIFDSISDTEDDRKQEHVHRDLVKKDREISDLKAQLQTYASSARFVGKGVDPKEFGKRMAKLEKAKNGEIEEIKKHYKSLMENLAKQIKKSNERHDDEIEKNDQLRSNMESMRNDMAAREQALEDKLIQMEAIVKKSEQKSSKLSSKLEKTEQNLTKMETKFKAAAKDREDQILKLKFLEADFEEERKELAEQFVKNSENSLIEKEKIIDDLNSKIAEIKRTLSATEGKLDIEERSHEESVLELRKLQVELKNVKETNEELVSKAKKAEEETALCRQQAQIEIENIDQSTKKKIGESNEMLNQMTETRLALSQQLKSTQAKLFAAEKKIEFIEENNTQKGGALRRKTYEMEQLQLELRELCDRHMKDLKARDLQAIRDLKKWNAAEQVLKKELEQIKMSPAYQKAQSESIPDAIPDNASNQVLRSMVEQLRADKASMRLQMNAIKDRTKRDMQILEKKLQDALKSKRDDPRKNTRRTISFSPSRTPAIDAPSQPVDSIYTTTREAGTERESPVAQESSGATTNATENSAVDHAPSKPTNSNACDDSSASDVSVTTSKKSLSHSPSYRRNLRARRRPLRRTAAVVPKVE